MSRNPYIARALWLLVLLSLLPGLWLAYERHQAEQTSQVVSLIIDGPDLTEQANLLGVSPFELAERYRALGLNGVSVYEDSLETLAAKGRIALMTGAEARTFATARGEAPPDIPANSTLASELTPGALEHVFATIRPQPTRVELNGATWWLFGGDAILVPAGPDSELIAAWQEAGWEVAYRPRNHPGLTRVGENFPGVPYLIHLGTEVAGNPDLLDALVVQSQGYVTGLIEGTAQDGMNRVIRDLPANRVFSIAQDWQNTLRPLEVADKYLLAANERGARLLYLRTYNRSRMGNPFENTERLIGAVATGLINDGFTIGRVGPLRYESDTLLRALSAVGVLASLGLLAMMYPGFWGPLIAVFVLLLGLAASGVSWNSLALIAALVFPVIGYGLLPERLTTLGVATLISLVGAVLLAAVGTDRNTMLAAEPFVGVAATLIVPPLLFILHYVMRYGRPVDLAVRFWNYPIRLGDAAVVGVALVALAVVFLRRGNFPVIGVSGAELLFRDQLAQLFAIRPRFKELLGHPAAVVALLGKELPDWLKGFLLTGGVVAQASILNSFSHYHSPLLVSLARTLIALALGLLLGLVLAPVVRWAFRAGTRWLSRAAPVPPRVQAR